MIGRVFSKAVRLAMVFLIGTGGLLARSPEQIYFTYCYACHGKDGKGAVPGAPDFTAANSPIKNKKKEELVNNIIKGYRSPGSMMAMPPKGGVPNLTESEAKQLVDYLKKRFP